MTLIITANNQNEVGNEINCGLQKPYSYRSYLKKPLVLPPNSEVAVVSVKVNKEGGILLDDNMRVYTYFNTDATLTENAIITDQSTGVEIECPLKPHLEGKPFRMVSESEFASIMTDVLKVGLPHPDYLNGNTTDIKVERLSDTGNTGYKGYKFTLQYQPPTTTNLFSDKWDVIDENSGDEVRKDYQDPSITTPLLTISNLGAGGIRVRANDDTQDGSDLNYAVAMKNPISRINGEVWFDLNECLDDNNNFVSEFAVGLNRCCDTAVDDSIPGLSFREGVSGNNAVCMEYGLRNVELATGKFFLVAFGVCGLENNAKPGSIYEDREIIYFDDNDGMSAGTTFPGSSFNDLSAIGRGRYEMSSNKDKSAFTHARFKVDNEIVEMYMGVYNGMNYTWTLITSYSLKASATAPKVSIPKPNGQGSWCLYPKIHLSNGDDIRTTPGSFNKMGITLEKYYGRDTGYNAKSNNGDFQYRVLYGNATTRMSDLFEMDRRPMMVPTLPDYTYVYNGVATGGLTNYQPQIVMDTSIYYPNCEGDMGDILGFPNRAYLGFDNGTITSTTGSTNNKIVYDSDSVPTNLDVSSMFIRLNNTTHNSYNTFTHSPSKILYHFPRFDNSGRDSGLGLYFEPNNRCYVKLYNENEMPLNEFDLSIVDVGDNVIEHLTGQTIIVLDIRTSKCACKPM